MIPESKELLLTATNTEIQVNRCQGSLTINRRNILTGIFRAKLTQNVETETESESIFNWN